MKSDHEFIVELGSILRNRREKLLVTQEEMGQESGFCRSYISDIERGARNISIRNLRRICKVLDLPLSTVLKKVEISLGENE